MINIDMSICQCFKKDGVRCSFKSKLGSPYCGIHKKCLRSSADVRPILKPTAKKSKVQSGPPVLNTSVVEELKALNFDAYTKPEHLTLTSLANKKIFTGSGTVTIDTDMRIDYDDIGAPVPVVIKSVDFSFTNGLTVRSFIKKILDATSLQWSTIDNVGDQYMYFMGIDKYPDDDVYHINWAE
jgi:hypothetical protein